MADITFTIPDPTLLSGDYFKYRYREVGGSYGGYTNVMTQTITISGLSTGFYEIEIIYVKADATECDAVVLSFTVLDAFTCYTFAKAIVQSGNQYALRISYTLPSPVTNPDCGWTLVWSQVGGSGTINYSSLPVSGVINIVLPQNADTDLTLIADLCDDNYQYCIEETVPKIDVPTCIPFVLDSYELQYFPSNNQWQIAMSGTQSTPATNPITIHYQEISTVNAGATPDSGISVLKTPIGAGQAISFTTSVLKPQGIFLHPAGFPDEYIPNCIRYNVSITDTCGNQNIFEIRGYWVPSGSAGQGVFTPWGC